MRSQAALLVKIVLFFVPCFSMAQQPARNIIIVTTDGFRWQEVFKGMDSAIANNRKYNQGDSEYIYKKYWDHSLDARRKKLFPFLWTTLVKQGELFGNRELGCKVDNANPYWFSYPGYNEIFTGYPDTAVNSNSYPDNPHENVLEYLDKQKDLKSRVAAFGAWDAFDRILNKKRSGFPVFSAFDTVGGKNPDANEKLINAMNRDSYHPFRDEESLDVFTHYAAWEYLKTKHPRVLYISYGETDEWAHAGQYRSYLDAAHQVDAWLKQIWDYVQQDPHYRNKTTLLITVDHGRGDLKKEEWTSHNNKISDAHQIWFGILGPDIPAGGEMNTPAQLYQEQFAQTIARLMGYRFKTDHPVAQEIDQVFKMKK
jgi:hypothetical protein